VQLREAQNLLVLKERAGARAPAPGMMQVAHPTAVWTACMLARCPLHVVIAHVAMRHVPQAMPMCSRLEGQMPCAMLTMPPATCHTSHPTPTDPPTHKRRS
jgi:hypothetical protein